jgi:glycosyltransferase involved in cell wall biosynthesis
MASGRPVVAFAVGGIPEMLGGEFAANAISPGDVSAFARRLEQLATDPDPDLGNRARAYIGERFSRDQMLDGMDRAFREARREPL